MTTIILVVALLAGAAFVAYSLKKDGKIQDANNNFIPDAIEAEVKEVVAEVKEKAKKVKAVADKVAKPKKSAKKAAK